MICKENYKNSVKLPNKYKNINWKEIQLFYDLNKTWKDITITFHISNYILSLACKLGLIKMRKSKETWLLRNPKRIGRKHSSETKEKLRKSRIKYLKEHPEINSWKINNKFKSIPCEKVKNELKQLNINFQEEHQPLLHKNRFFRIDIAFIDKKLGIEINGGQHWDSEGKLKPYYQERHDLIENEGWKLYEIPYHVAMRKDFVIEFIIPLLENKMIENYDINLYLPQNNSWSVLQILCSYIFSKTF